MIIDRKLVYACLAITCTPATQAFSEEIRLDDGTTCTIIEADSGKANGSGALSSTVTAGNGQVSSSTTGGGVTTTSQPSSSTSSASSSAGSGSVDSFSTASITRPDGTVVTKRSDGTCSVMKPHK